MGVRDLREGRWLAPLGAALLVALTVLDVVLIKLAFDHAQGVTPSPAGAVSSASGSPSATPPTPAAQTDASAVLPDGPVLLSLAPDGTVLRAIGGGCTDGSDPHVHVAPPDSATFEALHVAPDLAGVLAVRTDGRDDLTVVGTDVGCEIAAYSGSSGRRVWATGPARDEWYLDVTRDPVVVHAPGGRVDVPCAPVALSTLDAVRVLCDGGALVGTGDGGETWAALGRLRNATAVAFQGPSRGIALARRGACPVTVLSTDNGGARWETIGCLDGGSGRAVALRGETVAAAVDDALWRSTDGGETWRPQG